LQNPANGNYLIMDFAISYNYAASFITKAAASTSTKTILAFAPFTATVAAKDAAVLFKVLPSSQDEVKNLKGKIFTDTAATKNNFITYAPQYSIIHLATHASASDDNPAESYISFYPPLNSTAAAYKLYEPEICNLNLSNTSLVILSACETASGQLINGEGVISLSRAFSYAGCPGVITSMWKAEDNATAFITQHLHNYLQQGNTKDVALQKAKLDYLASPEIEPAFKTPNFWAHLILTGDAAAITNSNNYWKAWVLIFIFFITALFFFFKRKYKKLPA
jgi:CHAT domain-containing protein